MYMTAFPALTTSRADFIQLLLLSDIQRCMSCRALQCVVHRNERPIHFTKTFVACDAFSKRTDRTYG